jgi:hypothetical protein
MLPLPAALPSIPGRGGQHRSRVGASWPLDASATWVHGAASLYEVCGSPGVLDRNNPARQSWASSIVSRPACCFSACEYIHPLLSSLLAARCSLPPFFQVVLSSGVPVNRSAYVARHTPPLSLPLDPGRQPCRAAPILRPLVFQGTISNLLHKITTASPTQSC